MIARIVLGAGPVEVALALAGWHYFVNRPWWHIVRVWVETDVIGTILAVQVLWLSLFVRVEGYWGRRRREHLMRLRPRWLA